MSNWIEEAQAATGGICPDPSSHRLHVLKLNEACPHCGGSEPLARPQERDKVTFSAMRDPLAGDETIVRIPGTVTRVWTNDQYVTILTDDRKPRTFVRNIENVVVIPRGTS